MGYHYFFIDGHLKATIETFKGKVMPSETNPCFSCYDYIFHTPIVLNGGDFHVGLLLIDKVEQAIKDFHSNFSNIKIEVEFRKLLTDYTNWETRALNNFSFDWKKHHEDTTYAYLLSPKFSNDYENRTRYHMIPMIMQFFRMFSPCSVYKYFFDMTLTVEPNIKALLKGFNELGYKISTYGSFCHIEVSLDLFKQLDDPEFMNKVMEYNCLGPEYYYGSELVEWIQDYKEYLKLPKVTEEPELWKRTRTTEQDQINWGEGMNYK